MIFQPLYDRIRKRIQFMYGEKLRKIRFQYTGYSIKALLDRLPTAKIECVEQDTNGDKTVYTVSAEVSGDGIDMWLRSQGDAIKVMAIIFLIEHLFCMCYNHIV